MLLASFEAALDVLEFGLRSTASRRLANSGVMRTGSSVERAICWKCWVQEEPPDCLYPVKTSRRSVVVPRECKPTRDFVRCFYLFDNLVPERVDYGTPRDWHSAL